MPIVGFNEMVQKTLLLDDKIVKLYRKNLPYYLGQALHTVKDYWTFYYENESRVKCQI